MERYVQFFLMSHDCAEDIIFAIRLNFSFSTASASAPAFGWHLFGVSFIFSHKQFAVTCLSSKWQDQVVVPVCVCVAERCAWVSIFHLRLNQLNGDD